MRSTTGGNAQGNHMASQSPEKNSNEGFDPSQVTVLVAEASLVRRQTLMDILKDLGFSQVVATQSGVEAWTSLKEGVRDLVLADWDMPEMNGLALLKVMRADPSHFASPVILIAPRVTKSQVIEAGEAGVSDILLLPLTTGAVQKKIEGIFQSEVDPAFKKAQVYFHSGVELMDGQNWEEALAQFQKILDVHENAEVYYNLGYIKTAQSRYDEAIAYFLRAVKINNEFARAYERMAECYVQMNRGELAEKCFQKAAAIYMERNMDDNAEQMLAEVHKLNPNTINVYNSLGIIYRRQGNFEKAIDQYKKAIKVNSADENIYYNLGRIYFEAGQFGEAEKVLHRAQVLNPGFGEAKDLLRAVRRRIQMGDIPAK